MIVIRGWPAPDCLGLGPTFIASAMSFLLGELFVFVILLFLGVAPWVGLRRIRFLAAGGAAILPLPRFKPVEGDTSWSRLDCCIHLPESELCSGPNLRETWSLSSLKERIWDQSRIPSLTPVLGCCGSLELDGLLLPSDRWRGSVSSKYWMSTSWSLPEAEFATPSWRRGMRSVGCEIRSRADRLSFEWRLPSPKIWWVDGVFSWWGVWDSLGGLGEGVWDVFVGFHFDLVPLWELTAIGFHSFLGDEWLYRDWVGRCEADLLSRVPDSLSRAGSRVGVVLSSVRYTSFLWYGSLRTP